jgi:hypothetical protein
MANSAFKDSEIDYTDMMTDPHAFADRVWAKAEELKEICKADISIASLTRQMEEAKTSTPADDSIHVLLNGVYKYADDLPLEQMPAIIAAARQLVSDLETQFKDRIIYEAAKQADPSKDKKLAHAYYMDLRKAFNSYVEFVNGFGPEMIPTLKTQGELKTIPALPGNFGGSTTALKHYVFIYNGEELRNPAALSVELGIERIVMYDDMLAYLEAHPEHEVVVKVVM